MVNNCVVQGCVVGTAKQNVTLREFPTLLTMSNTIGFAKKRVINKTAVPTMFPSKRAVSQRSLSQPLDTEGRLGLAAGPRQRTAHASKQVFGN